jgi:F-type H+-transporting ATPase subunit a
MQDPLHQFMIQTLIPLEINGVNLSFTNSAAFMLLATLLVMAFQFFGIRHKALVPGRFQSLVEVSYEFIATTVRENAGIEGMKYMPFILALFMFILLGNLLGMLPYSFTFTSHIVVTFALAMLVFITVTVIGLLKHGLRFFRLFFPEGVPWAIAPILIPVELFTYLARPIIMSVRLFANMLAGHIILKILGAFTIGMGLFGVAPLALNLALTGFEFFVAFIQAYIFTVLTCLYVHDALHLH